MIRFTSLESIEFINVAQFHKIAKFFINTENEIQFAKTIKSLSINACFIPDEEHAEAFINIREFTLLFPSVTRLHFKGLRIGEHLGDMIAACKRPQIEELSFELNGIEPEFTLYFQMCLNFETI